jgi:hypothetical protein
VSTTAATATKENTWLREPRASPMTVRLPLLLTGKPWISPAATLAPPSPTSSWFASVGYPLRAANAAP